MGIELDIGYGLANLKLNLGDFLAVAQQIAGVTKHREAREALKASIEEIRKSCDTAVEVFTPLYALTDEDNGVVLRIEPASGAPSRSTESST